MCKSYYKRNDSNPVHMALMLMLIQWTKQRWEMIQVQFTRTDVDAGPVHEP